MKYATADGTRPGGQRLRGRVAEHPHLRAGRDDKTVAADLIGDKKIEPIETFFLKLSSPVGATLFDDTGVAKINNANDTVQTDVAVFRPSSGQWFVKDQFIVTGGRPAISRCRRLRRRGSVMPQPGSNR